MGRFWCKICGTFVDDNLKRQHLASGKHKSNVSKKIRGMNEAEKKQRELIKVAERQLGGSRVVKKRAKKAATRKVEVEVPKLNAWTVVDKDEEKSKEIEPIGVKNRKISAFETKMEEWDFSKKEDVSEDDELPKVKLRIRRRLKGVRKGNDEKVDGGGKQ